MIRCLIVFLSFVKTSVPQHYYLFLQPCSVWCFEIVNLIVVSAYRQWVYPFLYGKYPTVVLSTREMESIFLFTILAFKFVVTSYNAQELNTATTTPSNVHQTPTPTPVWPGKYNNGINMRQELGLRLLTGCNTRTNDCSYHYEESEIEPYDGFYNNIVKPELGTVGKFCNHINKLHLNITYQGSLVFKRKLQDCTINQLNC